ncbi:hypothetical protein GN956_G24288 [Arapaima gigas]
MFSTRRRAAPSASDRCTEDGDATPNCRTLRNFQRCCLRKKYTFKPRGFLLTAVTCEGKVKVDSSHLY